MYVFSHTCFEMMSWSFFCLFVWVFQCFLWGVWEGGVPISKKVFFIISKGSTSMNERVEVSHSPLKQCLRYLYIQSSSSFLKNLWFRVLHSTCIFIALAFNLKRYIFLKFPNLLTDTCSLRLLNNAYSSYLTTFSLWNSQLKTVHWFTGVDQWI